MPEGVFCFLNIVVPSKGIELKIPFSTPVVGSAKLIQPFFSEPLTPFEIFDEDGDLLSRFAESIIGTSDLESDTDNDGIDDYTEILQGTNPISGLAVSTGIIASAPTRSPAIDITAANNLAVTANGGAGVTVFNIFAGLNPSRIAEVDTPGMAYRVAADDDLVAIADGFAGLAVVDVSDPPSSRIVHEVPLGSDAFSVATNGPIAYVGTAGGSVVRVNMLTGEVLDEVSLAGSGPVRDVHMGGDVAYALRGQTISAIPLLSSELSVASTVTNPGILPNPSWQRLFAGEDVLLATNQFGWNQFNLSEDPLHPVLIDTVSTTMVGWKQIVPTGSGLGIGVAGAGVLASQPPHDVLLYDIGNNQLGSGFLTTFQTPGTALAASASNGLAYVADGVRGLQVLNYKAYDSLGIPPTISLTSNFVLGANTGAISAGKVARFSARVTDDVQVRNVEFYINGGLAFTDGTFPFEHRFLAPPLSSSFTVRARAVDTGGNEAWTNEYTITVMAETTPPQLLPLTQSGGAVLEPTDSLTVRFNEIMDLESLRNGGIVMTEAGADGIFGTADDAAVDPAEWVFINEAFSTVLRFDGLLNPGYYRIDVTVASLDLAGNALVTGATSDFRIASSVDSDNDGLADDYEALLGLVVGLADTDMNGIVDGDEDFDGDGVRNREEVVLGFDPTNPDSNGNGILDGAEDRDFDGLPDVMELRGETDYTKADTDGDGWDDAGEVAAGMNPLIPERLNTAAQSAGNTFINALREPLPVIPVSAESEGVSFENQISGTPVP